MFLRSIFLVLFFSYFSNAANETCPKCPTNGIWSEWTSLEVCNTTCGACSTLNRSRTCLTDQIGCPCVGNNTSTTPCNIQSCMVVQTNSKIEPCCNGLNATLINNLYYCLPPEEPSKLDCCPAGGYWSDWSDYTKVSNRVKWQRTRSCLSANVNCPCEGEDEIWTYTCPCATPITIRTSEGHCQAQIPEMKDLVQAVFTMVFRAQAMVRPSRCESYTMLEGSNFIKNFNWINETSTDKTPITVFANIDINGKCSMLTETGGAISGSGELNRIYHSCNLKTLRYERMSMVGLYKVSQFYQNT